MGRSAPPPEAARSARGDPGKREIMGRCFRLLAAIALAAALLPSNLRADGVVFDMKIRDDTVGQLTICRSGGSPELLATVSGGGAHICGPSRVVRTGPRSGEFACGEKTFQVGQLPGSTVLVWVFGEFTGTLERVR